MFTAQTVKSPKFSLLSVRFSKLVYFLSRFLTLASKTYERFNEKKLVNPIISSNLQNVNAP